MKLLTASLLAVSLLSPMTASNEPMPNSHNTTRVSGALAAAPDLESTAITCSWFGMCGRVTYKSGPKSTITVAEDWNASLERPTGTREYVARGKTSTLKDVDGIYIPSGCKGKWFKPRLDTVTYNPGWNKITDLQKVELTLVC